MGTCSILVFYLPLYVKSITTIHDGLLGFSAGSNIYLGTHKLNCSLHQTFVVEADTYSSWSRFNRC